MQWSTQASRSWTRGIWLVENSLGGEREKSTSNELQGALTTEWSWASSNTHGSIQNYSRPSISEDTITHHALTAGVVLDLVWAICQNLVAEG